VCILFLCGEDGRSRYAETFEAEDEAAALARFAELTGHAGLAPFDTAALRAEREFVGRFNTRDWAGIESLAAPELVFDERRRMLHNTCGRKVWLEQLRIMFDVPVSRFTTRLLATRGERLELSLHGFAGEVGTAVGRSRSTITSRCTRSMATGASSPSCSSTSKPRMPPTPSSTRATRRAWERRHRTTGVRSPASSAP
jgi:hypothetical protein